MKKRILSVVLAIVMVVGMLPGFALAASATDTTKTILAVGNGTVEAEPGKTYTCSENLCADTDNDHYCDDCGEYMPTLCSDADNDHWCDVCDAWMSGCTDEEDMRLDIALRSIDR